MQVNENHLPTSFHFSNLLLEMKVFKQHTAQYVNVVIIFSIWFSMGEGEGKGWEGLHEN